MREKTRLTLWLMPNAGFETGAITAGEIRRFQERNRGVEVKVCIVPWSRAWDRLMEIFTGRSSAAPPDVVQLGSTWVPSLMHIGMLQELPRPRGAAYIPQLLSVGSSGETLRALPWFTDLRVLYYRRDILADRGVEESSLEDFESLVAACLRLKGLRSHYPFALSGQREAVMIHDLAPWIWGFGGDFFSPDRKRLALSGKEALAGIRFYFEMIDRGFVPLQGRDVSRFSGNFFNGDCAMQVSGVWPVRNLFNPRHADYRREVARNFGITLFPRGPAGRATYIGGSHLAVTTRTRHPEAAAALAVFLSSADSQKRYLSRTGLLPSLPAIWDEFFPGRPRELDVFRRSLRHARTLPPIPAMGSVERSMLVFTQEVLSLLRKRAFSPARLRGRVKALTEEIDYMQALTI